VLAVLAVPGHDVVAAEALRVLERVGRDGSAALEVLQAQDDGRRPEIDGDAERGSLDSTHLFAIPQQQGPPSLIARVVDRGTVRIEPLRAFLDAQCAATHRVPTHQPGRGEAGAAGEAEAVRKMFLLRLARRQQLVTSLDLDQALAALALLVTTGRNADAERLGRVEECRAGGGRRLASVDAQAAAQR